MSILVKLKYSTVDLMIFTTAGIPYIFPMAKLFMTIKKQYFIEILAGTKTEDFRIVKPYLVSKLVGKEYSHIIFKNGYSRNSPRLEAEYIGYEVRNIRHEFFGNEDVSVFVLKLGTIKRNGNAI